MKFMDFIVRFLQIFVLAFVVTAIVTLFWNYLIKGNGLKVDWETSIRMALVFAIVIPLTQIRK
jgi:hypothetical protein